VTPPLDLRFVPGHYIPGIPNVPPVLERIFDLDCPEDDEVGVVISPSSGQSFYRTNDPIFNQRYRARLFVFQANSAGEYMIILSNVSGFSPFITASRSFATSWQATGDTLVFNVEADQTGPITIEVTTENPNEFGSFDLHLQCQMTVLAYWKMDETGLGPFNHGPTRIDSANGIELAVVTTQGVFDDVGILGRSARFTATPALFNRLLLTPRSIDLPYGSEDVTVTAWFFLETNSGKNLNHQIAEHNIYLGDIGGIFKGRLGLYYNGSLDSLFVKIANSSGSESTVTGLTGITLNQWYFIQGMYEQSTGLPKIRIDNGSIIVGATPKTISSGDRGELQCSHLTVFPTGASDVFRIDEIGIWHRALTTMEFDDMWNGGVGKTWPDVPM